MKVGTSTSIDLQSLINLNSQFQKTNTDNNSIFDSKTSDVLSETQNTDSVDGEDSTTNSSDNTDDSENTSEKKTNSPSDIIMSLIQMMIMMMMGANKTEGTEDSSIGETQEANSAESVDESANDTDKTASDGSDKFFLNKKEEKALVNKYIDKIQNKYKYQGIENNTLDSDGGYSDIRLSDDEMSQLIKYRGTKDFKEILQKQTDGKELTLEEELILKINNQFDYKKDFPYSASNARTEEGNATLKEWNECYNPMNPVYQQRKLDGTLKYYQEEPEESGPSDLSYMWSH